MNEEEAKTKWCPAVRVTAPDMGSEAGLVSVNRYESSDDGGEWNHCLCIGSACMAWRWTNKAGTKEDGSPAYYSGAWQGFCGLAGKP